MNDRSIYHPLFGRSVKNGATDSCSKCGHTIPEDHVPLLLWDKSGKFMWAYCESCDAKIIAAITQKAQPA